MTVNVNRPQVLNGVVAAFSKRNDVIDFGSTRTAAPMTYALVSQEDVARALLLAAAASHRCTVAALASLPGLALVLGAGLQVRAAWIAARLTGAGHDVAHGHDEEGAGTNAAVQC